MLRRGSAQLLLLFFRSGARLGWTIGAIAGVLIVAGMLRAGDKLPLLTRAEIAQALHQSAWQHALAGLPEPAPWPWAETSSGPASAVPQLGLSASVVKERGPGKDDGGDSEDPHVPRTKLSEVGVGDRITVTNADGSSRVYRIIGSRVVDPHLAQTKPGPSGGDPTLVTCLPLDPLLASSLRLVIQATKVDPPALPDPRPEQKL